MSTQAYGWAIDQSDVPARPALVLMALANHASHVDGRCWPSIDTIAREARCSRRAVFGYLAALERNGYIEIVRTRKKSGRQGVNNYFILFDRKPEPWLYHQQPDDPEPPMSAEDIAALEAEEEIQAAESRVQIEHPVNSVENPVENSPPECKADAPGQSATVCTRHVMPEPSDSRTLEQVEGRAPLITPSVPVGYRPKARIEQAASLLAAEEASKPKRFPVIEGSEAWKSWVRHGHKRTLTTSIEFNGRRYRGWYFETYFPPKSTGPPLDKLQASPDDLAPFGKEMTG